MAYELEWPEHLVPGSASPPSSPLLDAMGAVLRRAGDDAALVPILSTGFTDSVYLRAAGTPVAYGYTPFAATSAEVLAANGVYP